MPKKPITARNPRGAGRNPTGNVRCSVSLRLPQDVADRINAMDNKAGWITALILRELENQPELEIQAYQQENCFKTNHLR